MGNFKVRCVDHQGVNKKIYTLNESYEVKDGTLTTNTPYPIHRNFKSVEDINAFSGSRFELVEEPKMFSKSDLKTGMRVETRDGTVYVILLGTENDGDVLVNKSWMSLTDYDDNLIVTSSYYSNLDISKVYKQSYLPVDLFNTEKHGPLLWERIEPLKMTIREAQAELSKIKGREVKIVKE